MSLFKRELHFRLEFKQSQDYQRTASAGLYSQPQGRGTANAGNGLARPVSAEKHQPAAPCSSGLPIPAWRKRILYPNHVWGADITFIRGQGIWFYLVAVLDWYSRYVLSWQLSRTLTADFCVAALRQALETAVPEIHNSDQGSQFTSFEYIGALKAYPDIQISMDGRGRCFDNIFTERLWRTVKYEEVYLRDYQSFAEAEASLSRYFRLYNHRRLHQALDYKTPAEVYCQN